VAVRISVLTSTLCEHRCDLSCFRSTEWPPPYDFTFDHLHPKSEFFVDDEDAYYTTDLENEDGEVTGVMMK